MSSKTPPASKPSSDSLDDICPICGKPVKDDEPWSMTDHNEIAHEVCVELEGQ